MSGGRRHEAAIDQGDDDFTLAAVRRFIHFIVIRIDHVFLDIPCPPVDHVNSSGGLSGFKLSYKLPRAARGNAQLDREVVVNGSCALPESGRRVEEIHFKHKKVFPIELDSELIEVWDRSSVTIGLSMLTSAGVRFAGCNDRKNMKLLARASISLSDLLVPPFLISRDCTMSGADFHGRIAVSLELGSRNVRIAERLSDARKSGLEDTFVVQERKPARRTRARSSSRCRSHSKDEENQPPLNETAVRPISFRNSRASSVSSRRSTSRPVSPHVPRVQNSVPSVPVSIISRPEPSRPTHPPSFTNFPRVPQNVPSDESDDESVFTTTASLPNTMDSSRCAGGALQIDLTLHEAYNLPLVEDMMGNLVPPEAYVQMLGRDEQVVSSIAPASRNPIWNWKGRFVISSERGNLLIKVLHKQDDRIGVIGIVTLTSPLRSFNRSEYEVSLLSAHASGTATMTLSMNVKPYRSTTPLPMSREVVPPTLPQEFPRRQRPPSSSSSSRPESEIMWVGDQQQPRLLLRSRNSQSTSPRPPPRRVPFEEISHKLQDDVDDLLSAVNRLGR